MKNRQSLEFSRDGGKTWETIPGLRPSALPMWPCPNAAPETWTEYGYPPFSSFGSVDHYRSEDKGYRAHSRALKILAKLRHQGEELLDAYDRTVCDFYID